MTSLPMNSVLNSNLFICGEQSLDCLSAVVFGRFSWNIISLGISQDSR